MGRMTKEEMAKEIKFRLSNIGEAIGMIALEYIEKFEKENEQLKQQNEQLEKQIKDLESKLKDVIEDNDYYQKENKKMKQYCDCEFCKYCDNELTNPETGKTICDICNDNNLWELAE